MVLTPELSLYFFFVKKEEIGCCFLNKVTMEVEDFLEEVAMEVEDFLDMADATTEPPAIATGASSGVTAFGVMIVAQFGMVTA